jgi:hypothetical protein
MQSNEGGLIADCVMPLQSIVASNAVIWHCAALVDAACMVAYCSNGISRGQNVQAKRRGQTVPSKGQTGQLDPQAASLKSEVKQALLNVLRDSTASAASKASAGRTLLEYFAETESTGKKRGAELTSAELDAAIAERERRPRSQPCAANFFFC